MVEKEQFNQWLFVQRLRGPAPLSHHAVHTVASSHFVAAAAAAAKCAVTNYREPISTISTPK